LLLLKWFFNIEEYFQTQILDHFFTDAVILEVNCVGSQDKIDFCMILWWCIKTNFPDENKHKLFMHLHNLFNSSAFVFYLDAKR